MIKIDIQVNVKLYWVSTKFENVALLPPGKFFMFFCHMLNFFKISFFENFFQCQTDWIQIRPDILSGLIWVQSVCIGYQQMTPEGNKELIFLVAPSVI